MDTPIADPALTFAQVVTDFLNLLLDEGGMDNVSVEVRAQMLHDLRVRLNERLFATIILNLPEDKITEFRALSEKKDSGEALEKFIDGNISNAQEIFAGAFLTFRNDYLGLA